MNIKVELRLIPDTYVRLFDVIIDGHAFVLDEPQAKKLRDGLLREMTTHTNTLPHAEIVADYEAHKGDYGYGLRAIARKFNTNHMTVSRILKSAGVI